MALGNVPRCQHIKMNGTQCGSPALNRRRLCFFHRAAQAQQARIVRDQFKQARFVVPLLEDAVAVQMGLMQVMQMLAWGEMEPKIAGLLLYGLQTASANLRNGNFEAQEPTDVVIYREDVRETDIDGPQWDPDEFHDPDEENDGEGEELGEKSEEGKPEEVAAEAGRKMAESQEEAPRKTPTMEEARAQVKGLIHEWVLSTVEGKARRELGLGG
jgi:hypothetical protein